MAQNFIGGDREQELLLARSLCEWLPVDHLAWFVIDAVEAMEWATFYAVYRQDGHGRPAHEPSMMVTLLLYCYAIGERPSRRIERRCVEDVGVRVICANQARITRRSRASVSATSARWPTCSARCSGCARRPGWSGSRCWPSTGPRSAPMPRAIASNAEAERPAAQNGV